MLRNSLLSLFFLLAVDDWASVMSSFYFYFSIDNKDAEEAGRLLVTAMRLWLQTPSVTLARHFPLLAWSHRSNTQPRRGDTSSRENGLLQPTAGSVPSSSQSDEEGKTEPALWFDSFWLDTCSLWRHHGVHSCSFQASKPNILSSQEEDPNSAVPHPQSLCSVLRQNSYDSTSKTSVWFTHDAVCRSRSESVHND